LMLQVSFLKISHRAGPATGNPQKFLRKIDVSVFENFGTVVLERSLKNSELIVLDEMGVMEKQTKKFKKLILQCLNAPQPVLGAFQKRAVWFLDILKGRQDTKVFLINEDNRDICFMGYNQIILRRYILWE